MQDQINNLAKSAQTASLLPNDVKIAPGGTNMVGTTTPFQQNQSNNADIQPSSNNSGAAVANSGSSSTAGSSSSVNPPPVKSSPAPVLNNQSDAVQYAIGRFSPSEIVHYMAVYQNRQNLTQAQKDQIKSELLSRFTPQELQALSAAANK